MFRPLAAALAPLVLALPPQAQAGWRETVLHNFADFSHGGPPSELIFDAAGNLYGTANGGGRHGLGLAFELTPSGLGRRKWAEHVLYDFDARVGGGGGTGLAMDQAGNLYGVSGYPNYYGRIYRLSPPAPGHTQWTATVLHSFNDHNGRLPDAGVTLDANGNIFGTTFVGGKSEDGVVYEVKPPQAGQNEWSSEVLYEFTGPDGEGPASRLILDPEGNLYGTTTSGGSNGRGTVFRLSPPSDGQKHWTETVLHSFDDNDGIDSEGALARDPAGNLYGTTVYGGPGGYATVFELSPPPPGQTAWTETILYTLKESFPAEPNGVILDKFGNLYGTAQNSQQGLAFKLHHPAHGQTQWTQEILHQFPGSDFMYGLTADNVGNLYGSTEFGGIHQYGTVFSLTP